jgi:hypothetical protein
MFGSVIQTINWCHQLLLRFSWRFWVCSKAIEVQKKGVNVINIWSHSVWGESREFKWVLVKSWRELKLDIDKDQVFSLILRWVPLFHWYKIRVRRKLANGVAHEFIDALLLVYCLPYFVSNYLNSYTDFSLHVFGLLMELVLPCKFKQIIPVILMYPDSIMYVHVNILDNSNK